MSVKRAFFLFHKFQVIGRRIIEGEERKDAILMNVGGGLNVIIVMIVFFLIFYFFWRQYQLYACPAKP